MASKNKTHNRFSQEKIFERELESMTLERCMALIRADGGKDIRLPRGGGILCDTEDMALKAAVIFFAATNGNEIELTVR
jgi:hypothetical protein